MTISHGAAPRGLFMLAAPSLAVLRMLPLSTTAKRARQFLPAVRGSIRFRSRAPRHSWQRMAAANPDCGLPGAAAVIDFLHLVENLKVRAPILKMISIH
jgi:hypothetical protein